MSLDIRQTGVLQRFEMFKSTMVRVLTVWRDACGCSSSGLRALSVISLQKGEQEPGRCLRLALCASCHGPGGLFSGAGVILFDNNFSCCRLKFIRLEKRNLYREGRKMCPHLNSVPSGVESCLDDLSISLFPCDANFLSNVYFRGTSKNKCKSGRKKEKWRGVQDERKTRSINNIRRFIVGRLYQNLAFLRLSWLTWELDCPPPLAVRRQL